MKQKLWYQTL